MKVTFEKAQDDIFKYLQGITQRSKSIEGFLNRNVYPEYQNQQRERWETENTSQGTQWRPLEDKYKKYKAKKFMSYEGRGTKLMIATGRLQRSVIGPDGDHRKLVTPKTLEIATTVEYAKYAAEKRPIMKFSKQNVQKMLDMIVDYIDKNKLYE